MLGVKVFRLRVILFWSAVDMYSVYFVKFFEACLGEMFDFLDGCGCGYVIVLLVLECESMNVSAFFNKVS
jgi:hypothetical protein